MSMLLLLAAEGDDGAQGQCKVASRFGLCLRRSCSFLLFLFGFFLRLPSCRFFCDGRSRLAGVIPNAIFTLFTCASLELSTFWDMIVIAFVSVVALVLSKEMAYPRIFYA